MESKEQLKTFITELEKQLEKDPGNTYYQADLTRAQIRLETYPIEDNEMPQDIGNKVADK